jgi:hypothetical protein
MARVGGLGPLGHAAVERAATENRRAPVIDEAPRQQNPAVTSTASPDEDESVPSNWYTFDSSRVQEAAYDSQAQRLYVRFVKPVASGGTPWTYEGVPSNVWNNFRRSQSPGKFVNRVLNGYDYHPGRWS